MFASAVCMLRCGGCDCCSGSSERRAAGGSDEDGQVSGRMKNDCHTARYGGAGGIGGIGISSGGDGGGGGIGMDVKGGFS